MIHTAYQGEARIKTDCSPSISTPSGGGHLPMVITRTRSDVDRIRRLTPVECELLQGFPDNWTKYGIDKNGKQVELSDTQRYKMCGNAVSVPVITAIANKLYEALNVSG
jgi:DNA (cytosine-5)-methyltransferase 1